MRIRKVALILVAAVLPLSVACAPHRIGTEASTAPVAKSAGTGGELAGSSWMLTELNGQPPLANTAITLQFLALGRLAGSDGCNNYNTSYTVDGDKISINPQIATTLMACEEAIMQQAAAYLKALPMAATYEINGDMLTLRDANGDAILAYKVQSQELAGTSWEVTGYNNGKQAVVSVINGTAITAQFGADGNVSGSAGCNNYTAPYQTDGDKITIGMAAVTMKACVEPDGIMEQESQYLAALQTAATYRIDGDTMELRTAEGAIAATFRRAAP